MILLFDIGNSQIVLGIAENNKITSTYRFTTNPDLSVDEYYHVFKTVIPSGDIIGVAISNVVPSLDLTMKNMCLKYFKINPFFVVPGIKSGLKLKIEEPKSLGADLLCDAVTAVEKYHKPTFICDLGTATKIIVTNQNKEYLGGMIAPGIKGSLNSLISTAAKLSETSLEIPPHVVCNNTTTCIQSGVVYGTAAMLEGWIKKAVKELNFSEYEVILTGGLAGTVKDVLDIKFIYEPDFLLQGLLILYNKNR